MVLTSQKIELFFRLLKDDTNENYDDLVNLINLYPQLLTIESSYNFTAHKSPLNLAILNAKFNVAIALIQKGASPNALLVDISSNEFTIKPIFFNFLYTLSQLIYKENFILCDQFLQLLKIMDIYDLDYNVKMQDIYAIQQEINCLQYFLQLVADNYACKHKIYSRINIHNKVEWCLGNKDQNLLQEYYYEYIIRHILLKIDEKYILDLNAKDYRVNSKDFLLSTNNSEFVDSFALEICNKHVKELFNYNIVNYEYIL